MFSKNHKVLDNFDLFFLKKASLFSCFVANISSIDVLFVLFIYVWAKTLQFF